MSKLTHCGRAIKWLFAVTNAFIVLFGLTAIVFGVFLTVIREDLDYVTGSEVYSGAVVCVTAGVAIVIVAAFGIVAGWSEMWQLLTFYNICASGLFVVTLAGAIFSVATQESIYQRAKDEFQEGISSYRQENDSDYNSRANHFVDDIQSWYHCCGLNEPQDWTNQGLDYCIDNKGLPDSCNCTSNNVDEDCTKVNIPPTGLVVYTSNSWKKGCDEPIDDLTFQLVLYGGMAVVAMLLCEGLAVCCSCRLCYLLLRHSRRQRRDMANYRPLETDPQESASSLNTEGQTSEFTYPPPPPIGYNQHDSSYYASSHPV